jgi:ribosomal protein L34E
MANISPFVPSLFAFLHLMAKIWPTVPLLSCVSSSDGKNLSDRAIPNLLIFIRWQKFRPSCHHCLAFLHLMANIRPTVPLLSCVSSSDGKNFADRAIPNLLIFIRWQKFRPSCHHCHAFLRLMANIRPTVPSQTYLSLSDGKHFAHRAIAAWHFSI